MRTTTLAISAVLVGTAWVECAAHSANEKTPEVSADEAAATRSSDATTVALSADARAPSPSTDDTRTKLPIDEITVSVGLFTRHVNPDDDTNENTQFLALGIDRWVVARYRNSYDHWTVFAGRKWQSDKWSLVGDDEGLYLQGNLYAGLLHGYRDRFPNIAGVTIGVAPTIALGYKRSSFELMYVPTDTGGVFSTFFTYAFDH